MIETNLAQTVDATNDAGSAYDTNIKYLLADKQILSRILKYTIEEISLDRKTVFGNKKNPYHTDLMKGIIVNIRNGKR